MRDPAGELPDRLHLVGLPQLCFERAPFCDVDRDAGAAQRHAGLIVEEVRGRRDAALGAAWQERSIFELGILVFADRFVDGPEHQLPILGVDAVDESRKALSERAALEAVHDLTGLGPVADARFEIRFPDAEPRCLQREAHQLFCLVEGSLPSDAFGDVTGHDRHRALFRGYHTRLKMAGLRLADGERVLDALGLVCSHGVCDGGFDLAR